MKLASRLGAVAPFHVMAILERARQLEANGRDVIHLEVGEPDFATPPTIIEAGRRALAEGQVFYTPAQGIAPLREAIAAHYATAHGVHIDPRRILVTPGASAGLMLALSLFVDAGQSVLMADPTYPCNRHFVSVLGGRPHTLPVGPQTRFQPTAAMLAAAWQADTAGAMVATPGNPTGTTLSLSELSAMAKVCRSRDGMLLVDEIYQGLTYGVPAETALAVADDIIVINSFSKLFQMTGWRLGWVVVPAAWVEPALRLAQNLFLCPPAPAQHAALAAFLPETLALVETRRQILQRRRDFLLEALPGLGWHVPVVPDGAFYLYADVSAVTTDSFAYCRQVLEETGVGLTPGCDFGQHEAGRYLRVAYTADEARLAEAVARLRALQG